MNRNNKKKWLRVQVFGPNCLYLNLDLKSYWLVIFPFLKDFIKKKKKRFYLFMRDTKREAETKGEGEAGSLWRARCGT